MNGVISARRAREIAVKEYDFRPRSAAVTLRKAAERGRDGKGMVIAVSDPIDGWQYDETALRAWLSDPTMHRRGTKPRKRTISPPRNDHE